MTVSMATTIRTMIIRTRFRRLTSRRAETTSSTPDDSYLTAIIRDTLTSDNGFGHGVDDGGDDDDDDGDDDEDDDNDEDDDDDDEYYSDDDDDCDSDAADYDGDDGDDGDNGDDGDDDGGGS